MLSEDCLALILRPLQLKHPDLDFLWCFLVLWELLVSGAGFISCWLMNCSAQFERESEGACIQDEGLSEHSSLSLSLREFQELSLVGRLGRDPEVVVCFLPFGVSRKSLCETDPGDCFPVGFGWIMTLREAIIKQLCLSKFPDNSSSSVDVPKRIVTSPNWSRWIYTLFRF